MGSYRDLVVYKEAYGFVIGIYSVTRDFPQEEKYGIVSQIRRAATSVVANIVEGQSRGSNKDFSRFLRIARASLSECELFLELSKDLGYISVDMYDDLVSKKARIGYLISRLMNKLA